MSILSDIEFHVLKLCVKTVSSLGFTNLYWDEKVKLLRYRKMVKAFEWQGLLFLIGTLLWTLNSSLRIYKSLCVELELFHILSKIVYIYMFIASMASIACLWPLILLKEDFVLSLNQLICNSQKFGKGLTTFKLNFS